ncbi:flagellar motor protein [Aetokthonos hydrillicola Thurmond2011]|jgi:outer membrane protein OmpA-like peptidoglycan-associated protein|uniref:Flagellar motor protein n=1 Tax=Aetokthonos hydrillicola Thurmond2011 TaxID=2712845 RepID=A0AAP5MEE8_9CYAN|nr:flagellar motor protein [Aetokthonos hydrillicola]MBO3462088.1 flagellar motor protein [Aetokthonos hydrillicola CCALA 1050]MBW4585600.1 flagellar motor protein [Aetokthonos hydrillicola CCALA 1050]MDR9900844.1 flagellar motor protein [Aetokthonos hydrillicola Thurmond2011]
MARRSRNTDYYEELNIWTAFTDLMSNAFMILLLLLFIANIRYATPQMKKTGPPPYIAISDEEHRFAPGSAVISPEMSNYINNKIVRAIEKNTKEYTIDTVEVIGHTDGQLVGSAASNLDTNLEAAASRQGSVSILKAGSNADLGLMRSLAVVKELLKIQQQQGRMRGIKFRAYSAAQLILPPNAGFAPIPQKRQPEVERRRIEIRFTRSGEAQKV